MQQIRDETRIEDPHDGIAAGLDLVSERDGKRRGQGRPLMSALIEVEAFAIHQLQGHDRIRYQPEDSPNHGVS
jgi:hypothetical protein